MLLRRKVLIAFSTTDWLLLLTYDVT